MIVKNTTINIRMSKKDKDTIDKAAAALYKTRTDFIVDSARAKALQIVCNQNEEEFNKALDNYATDKV